MHPVCTEMMQRYDALNKEGWKQQLSKGEQSIACIAIMKERRECDVSGGPGMLKEDKVSTQPSSLSHHPAAGFISSTQQERWFSFVPLKQVSLTGFMACCYMPSPRSVCMCLLVLKQQFSLLFCCFLYFAKSKTFLTHTQTHTKTCTWLAWFTDLIL